MGLFKDVFNWFDKEKEVPVEAPKVEEKVEQPPSKDILRNVTTLPRRIHNEIAATKVSNKPEVKEGECQAPPSPVLPEAPVAKEPEVPMPPEPPKNVEIPPVKEPSPVNVGMTCSPAYRKGRY
jgi:hypothetical protein